MSDNTALYNCTTDLWKNCAAGTKLKLVDGMCFQQGEGWVARFRNDSHATEILTEAGFVRCDLRYPSIWEKIVSPTRLAGD